MPQILIYHKDSERADLDRTHRLCMILESMDSKSDDWVNNLYFPDQLQNVGVVPEESTACER
jgi:hypothetical protein